MKILAAILIVLAIVLLGLAVIVFLDRRADRSEWDRLARLQPDDPRTFDEELVADLPDPARRYFTYVIQPDTPLLPVVEIEMTGQFSLGTNDNPRYQPMEARQVLAAPEGFVWAMRTTGGMPVAGSDSGLWTRFRIFGLIPVARSGGDPDHARSAFGRYVAEAVIWSPAAMLPGPGVSWAEVDHDTARVTVRREDLSQVVDVTVDAQGRPESVFFERWTNANPDKAYRLQPFGAVVSDFREVGGYRLPFHVEAGNMFGTDDYFPFFIANITALRFPGGQP
ncbi:hypothetical protein SAMN05421666_0730 [Roseovarius nanhaiticus]|uniref:Uncharacterized protein n=1 Tax=Roseovarius nanhaiticus TaxID=573024 RepID=A0A1N7F434_9RHOB|nr:DUF6544 family protein [Roseovarius nanhaiticus]SEK62159.1 hypothetical protein SAMN05216208_1405 [Roseovarius nanhaiticus]SIR95049.1 hypothetical protein SAMN05421666_0730 [Roseovarius nanhaiticus]